MKVLEILRLYEMEQFTYKQIGEHAGVGKSTVGDVIKRCKEAGINYQKAQAMSVADLTAILYPARTGPKKARAEPDFPRYHAQMQSSRFKNLEYIWTEVYRVEEPDGYSYSHFCYLYGLWCNRTGKKVVMPLEREPGKELFIDWIGDKVRCVVDTATGNHVEAHFWISTLGDSSYPFVEAFPDETQVSWTQAHVDAFKWYGGIPRILVPDNTKTAVVKRTMYDPELNHSYLALANHYALAILPARVRKPRDKGSVESGAGWLETWLLGWIEDKVYFSFEQLNRDIRIRLKEFAARDFKERPGSRESVFEALDKPALRPLPKDVFEPFETKPVKSVPDDYHVKYDGFYYSVPYTYYKRPVEIHVYPRRIEVFNAELERIAIHARRFTGKRYVTLEEHMPANHKAILAFRTRDGSDYRKIALSVGENTAKYIDALLTSGPIEEQYYKSCSGILFGFRKKYGDSTLEAACKKALDIQAYTYTTIKNILEKGMYTVPEAAAEAKPTPQHENLRTGEWM
jgi:transposase